MSILKKAAAVIAAGAVLMTSGCFGFGGGELTPNPVRQYDYSTMHLIQLEEPYDGQPMAVIETTYGTIKAVLYPEQAPNTVANFVNCANDGYYDGKDVYCIVDGAFFMTGSVDEVRNSGITSDGQPIANEYSVDLWPFKGAICSFAGQAGLSLLISASLPKAILSSSEALPTTTAKSFSRTSWWTRLSKRELSPIFPANTRYLPRR